MLSNIIRLTLSCFARCKKACSRGEKEKRKEDKEEEKEGTIGDHKLFWGIHAHHFLCEKITVTLFRAKQLLALRVNCYCFQAKLK